MYVMISQWSCEGHCMVDYSRVYAGATINMRTDLYPETIKYDAFSPVFDCICHHGCVCERIESTSDMGATQPTGFKSAHKSPSPLHQ